MNKTDKNVPSVVIVAEAYVLEIKELAASINLIGCETAQHKLEKMTKEMELLLIMNEKIIGQNNQVLLLANEDMIKKVLTKESRQWTETTLGI